MNGSQKNAPAMSALQLFPQVGSALYTHHGVVAYKLFGIGKLCRKLVVQIGAVGNQHNGGTCKMLTLHQQAGEV